jgi:hypothetical protein
MIDSFHGGAPEAEIAERERQEKILRDSGFLEEGFYPPSPDESGLITRVNLKAHYPTTPLGPPTWFKFGRAELPAGVNGTATVYKWQKDGRIWFPE